MPKTTIMLFSFQFLAGCVGATATAPNTVAGPDSQVADGSLDTGSVVNAKAALLAVGGDFACAVLADGVARCWGANAMGQLAIGKKPADYAGQMASEAYPVVSTSLKGVTALAAGPSHACALTAAGALCWGDNQFGQIGNGLDATAYGASNLAAEFSAKPVQKLTKPSAIGAGRSLTCALQATIAWCWGDNTDGALGGGAGMGVALPAQVKMPAGSKALAVGGRHACVVKADGTVACWGNNGQGQANPGGAAALLLPQVVAQLDKATAIVAGNAHTCTITLAGAVQCWGDGSSGQLAGAASGVTTIAGVTDAVALAAGASHTCALASQGSVSCWGANDSGQLAATGAGPVTVAGLAAIAIAAGGHTTCAITKTGTVVCWGAGAAGQLGDGNRKAMGTAAVVQWNAPAKPTPDVVSTETTTEEDAGSSADYDFWASTELSNPDTDATADAGSDTCIGFGGAQVCLD